MRVVNPEGLKFKRFQHTKLEDLEIVIFFFFSSFDGTKMKQYIHASRLVGYITGSDII
jgi:hypothetical protein